jgi:hypothetical protein
MPLLSSEANEAALTMGLSFVIRHSSYVCYSTVKVPRMFSLWPSTVQM